MGKGFIKGYPEGSDITLLNTMYHKAKKLEDGTYSDDSIDIIFKDMRTGEKKCATIYNPSYRFYMTKPNVPVSYNKLLISKNDVNPVDCEYSKVKKTIAKLTNNLEFFYDNNRNGNYRENDKLFTIPSVFNADMHVEDYYRWLFDRTYKNNPFKPTKLYFDIEVDGINQRGDFPEMGECPVNAVTLVDEDGKKVYTLLLENYNNPLIEEFKNIKDIPKRLKDFVRERVGGWKNEIRFGLDKFNYHVIFYDEEIKLIHDMFNVINTIKPDFALAWNIAFDLPYLIQRILALGYNPEDIICHPDFPVKECYYYIDPRAQKFEERGDYAQISSYTVYLDQLISYASIRKGQRSDGGYKLDYIGQKKAGVNKLDYSHITRNIVELPYKDYYTFVFYNVMDTIVQLCIESKVNDIDFIYNKAMNCFTRYSKIHRQTVYLINRATKEFYDMGYVIGNNINKHNQKVGFAGAFVADPLNVSDEPKMKINDNPINLFSNLVDMDYTALYPSLIDQNNIAPNTQHGKIVFPEAIDKNENRFNNEYFDRSVWFSEDFVSRDYINFCERYLNLAGYEEMFNDIISYFSTVKRPVSGLRHVDTMTGGRIMCDIVPKDSKRVMCEIIDNSNGRIMCDKIERMNKHDA